MQLKYIISAVCVLFGGAVVLINYHGNKPLKLLSLFLVSYMVLVVEDSRPVWVVELLLGLFIPFGFKKTIRDNQWYVFFVLYSIASLLYSKNPIRGIPGIAMYMFPMFYYGLAITAMKNIRHINRLFSVICRFSWLLIPLSVASALLNHTLVYKYYGMSICMIPILLFFKTKKKQHIIQFLICLLPPLLTVKRTPLLGTAVAIAVFFALLYKWKAIVPILLTMLVGGVLVFSIPQFRARLFYGGQDVSITTISDISDNSNKINTSGRIEFWAFVWDKYHKPYPYWGAGQGTVKAFLQSDQNTLNKTFRLMHNDWLLVLCELGWIGTLILLMHFITVLVKCIKYSGHKYPYDVRLISAACAGTFASTMTHMFFENCMNSFVISTAFVFYAILNVYYRSYYNTGHLQESLYEKQLYPETHFQN